MLPLLNYRRYLSASNQRITAELNGRVSRITADLTYDERTGLSWYLACITVLPEERVRFGNLMLVPGMPSEVLIQTSERSGL